MNRGSSSWVRANPSPSQSPGEIPIHHPGGDDTRLVPVLWVAPGSKTKTGEDPRQLSRGIAGGDRSCWWGAGPDPPWPDPPCAEVEDRDALSCVPCAARGGGGGAPRGESGGHRDTQGHTGDISAAV